VPVQIFDEAFVLSVAPAGIIPTAPPPDAFASPVFGFVVTVLPLAVVVVAGGIVLGCAGRVGVRGVVRAGALFFAVDAGASGVAAGTSLSCGCAFGIAARERQVLVQRRIRSKSDAIRSLLAV
jgi:hypothetical protein